MTKNRHWTWYLSAPFYKRTYIPIAHQLDDDLFAYLGTRAQDALVADCGCGPGIVTEKFLKQGAKRVFAIDVNPKMLNQVRERLADEIVSGKVIPLRRSLTPGLFSQLRAQFLDGGGLDIILFKRSLYMRREEALPILRAAVDSLNKNGALAVIHGERSLRRYAFGRGMRPTHYTLYHLFNRAISMIGQLLGLGHYQVYNQAELLNLLREAALNHSVEQIPTRQRAYNIGAVIAQNR
jgi:SAM-dependent methyltransferase